MLLCYGAYFGCVLLDRRLQERLVPPRLTRGSLTSKRWSTRLSWGEFFHAWAWAVALDWRVGSVTMLSFMCIPLAGGFLAYHVYLVWAGVTTNESGKWSDWKEDIADDLVFRAEMKRLRRDFPPLPEDVEPRDEDVMWPRGVRAKWWLVRTRDGEQPKKKQIGRGRENGAAGSEGEVPDERWERVQSIAQVDNLYDLGFWDNIWYGMFNRC